MSRISRTAPRLPISALSIIVSNSLPLYWVLFSDLNVFPILLIYWVETVIIGFFTFLKILKAQGATTNKGISNGSRLMSFQLDTIIAGFFSIHYSIFNIGHLIFIILLFGTTNFSLAAIGTSVISLILSRYLSFQLNYIQGKEYLYTRPQVLMFQAYKRVIAMHIAIILGAFWIKSLGTSNTEMSLVFLLLTKIAIDLAMHRQEHLKSK